MRQLKEPRKKPMYDSIPVSNTGFRVTMRLSMSILRGVAWTNSCREGKIRQYHL